MDLRFRHLRRMAAKVFSSSHRQDATNQNTMNHKTPASSQVNGLSIHPGASPCNNNDHHKESRTSCNNKDKDNEDSNTPSNNHNHEFMSQKSGTAETCVKIQVDIDTTYPDNAWRERYSQEFPNARDVKLRSLFSGEKPANNVLRFVCLSDTHSRVERSDFSHQVPDGDVLLHAGDFTMSGAVDEMIAFNEFLAELPHKIKLVIPGNHELTLDPRGHGVSFPHVRREMGLQPIADPQACVEDTIQNVKGLVPQAKILIDELVEVCGLKIYGLPWLPEYGLFGFGLSRGPALLQKYNRCPPGVDILLSHGPALGFGDLTLRRKHVGCVELLNSVTKRIRPKFMVSGHIHEGYGARTDGVTTFINCAICNKNYRPKQAPIVFEVLLPHPYTREDFELLTLGDLKVTKPWRSDQRV